MQDGRTESKIWQLSSTPLYGSKKKKRASWCRSSGLEEARLFALLRRHALVTLKDGSEDNLSAPKQPVESLALLLLSTFRGARKARQDFAELDDVQRWR